MQFGCGCIFCNWGHWSSELFETNIFWEVKLWDCKKADECNKSFLCSYCIRNKKFICSHKNQEKKVVQIAEGKLRSSHDAFCNWSRHLFHYACLICYSSLFSWCSTKLPRYLLYIWVADVIFAIAGVAPHPLARVDGNIHSQFHTENTGGQVSVLSLSSEINPSLKSSFLRGRFKRCQICLFVCLTVHFSGWCLSFCLF